MLKIKTSPSKPQLGVPFNKFARKTVQQVIADLKLANDTVLYWNGLQLRGEDTLDDLEIKAGETLTTFQDILEDLYKPTPAEYNAKVVSASAKYFPEQDPDLPSLDEAQMKLIKELFDATTHNANFLQHEQAATAVYSLLVAINDKFKFNLKIQQNTIEQMDCLYKESEEQEEDEEQEEENEKKSEKVKGKRRSTRTTKKSAKKSRVGIRVPDIVISGGKFHIDIDTKHTCDKKTRDKRDIELLPTTRSYALGVAQIPSRAKNYLENTGTEVYRYSFTDANHFFFTKVSKSALLISDQYTICPKVVNYTNMTVKELKNKLKEQGVKHSKSSRKTDLINLFKVAESTQTSTSSQTATGSQGGDTLGSGLAVYVMLARHLLWLYRIVAQAEPAKLCKYIAVDDICQVIKVRDTTTKKIEEFTLLSTLGCGAHSVVHRAYWHSNSQEVSLKFEPISDTSQLLNEAYILTKLAGLPGVPALLSCGITLDRSKYYSAIDVIGSSLNQHKWTTKDIDLFWKAAVEIVRGIHSKGVAIMDLKPEHLILSPRGLFIVDYGCSYFVANGQPIIFMLSSPIFSSVREETHFMNPGFAADWESLIFSFMYVIRNKRLPWFGPSMKLSMSEVFDKKSRVLRRFAEIPPNNITSVFSVK